MTKRARYRPRDVVEIDEAELEPWVQADALRSVGATRLAAWRLRRGVMQRELADAVGVGVSQLRELERGENNRPSLRVLVNCALALGVDVTDLLEPEWLEWEFFNADRPAPPSPRELWRRAPLAAPSVPPPAQ